MKKLEVVTLPSIEVRFDDAMGFLLMREIYTKGLYPAFVEKMANLVSKHPHILNGYETNQIPQTLDSTHSELSFIKNMLEEMHASQQELTKLVSDYSNSFEVISSELSKMQKLASEQQNVLTEVFKAISETRGGKTIMNKLGAREVDIDIVQKAQETIVESEAKVAQIAVKPTINTNPVASAPPPARPMSVVSELSDLDLEIFDKGMEMDELMGFAKDFKG